jgi:flagellar FliL protein
MPQIPTLEAAPGQEGVDTPKRKGKLALLLALAAVIVLGGGGTATYYMLAGGSSEKVEAAKGEAQPKGPPLYVALDPPFVVNFEAEQLVRFLQVTVEVMSRDAATVEIIRANNPVVRNDLLLLLGNQNYETISSREGKEKLRLQSLETVRKVVASAGGKPALVEAVYFTSFVMQ